MGINFLSMLITFDQKEYQKLNDKSYQLEKRRLQIELLKLQEDVIKNNRRLCIIFEGRDTAGKSSTFQFFSQYLIPKNFAYVNLGIPTKWESSHWFKRWKKVIPKKTKKVLKKIQNTAGDLAGGSTNLKIHTLQKDFIFFKKNICEWAYVINGLMYNSKVVNSFQNVL